MSQGAYVLSWSCLSAPVECLLAGPSRYYLAAALQCWLGVCSASVLVSCPVEAGCSRLVVQSCCAESKVLAVVCVWVGLSWSRCKAGVSSCCCLPCVRPSPCLPESV